VGGRCPCATCVCVGWRPCLTGGAELCGKPARSLRECVKLLFPHLGRISVRVAAPAAG